MSIPIAPSLWEEIHFAEAMAPIPTIVGDVVQAAPRVTVEQIEAEITSEHYFTAMSAIYGTSVRGGFFRNSDLEYQAIYDDPVHAALARTLFCVLVLKNGQRYTGINYGSVHADNYSAVYGRQAARKQAFDQLWTVFGFELAQKLHREKQD